MGQLTLKRRVRWAPAGNGNLRRRRLPSAISLGALFHVWLTFGTKHLEAVFGLRLTAERSSSLEHAPGNADKFDYNDR